MCGIAGYLDHPGKVNENLLLKAIPCLQERGPDYSQVWVNEERSAGFAHTRLAIIDLDPRSNQPFTYLERYRVVFNGEIYNYQSLRKELETLHGLHFTTLSDTEVLAAAYHIFGIQCLQHFNGMFAFAIWDEKEQTLFCARDRFGEKPFYYFRNEQTFLFGSKAAAIHALGIKRNINSKLLLHYLAGGQTNLASDPMGSFYNDIQVLPPAHYLFIERKKNSFHVQRYWDLAFHSRVDQKDSTEELYSLLQASVKERLNADVPIGASISGGLDSSTIAYLISTQFKLNLAGFSSVFPGFKKDESRYIDILENSLPIQKHYITPGVQDLELHLLNMIRTHDHPIADLSSFAQYMVYRLAKQCGYTVMLDGQGADEILGGYSKYNHWAIQDLVRQNKFSNAIELFKSLKKNQQEIKGGWMNFLLAYLPGQVNHKTRMIYRNQLLKNDWLNGEFKNEYFKIGDIEKPLVRSLNDILYFDTTRLGLQELLRYADCNSMAHGVEIRLPFLDHRLVEYIFNLPVEQKIHKGYNKFVLRKAMNEKLPAEITWRKTKIGFEVPKDQWIDSAFMKEIFCDAQQKLVSTGVLKNKELPLLDKAARWRVIVAGQLLEKGY